MKDLRVILATLALMSNACYAADPSPGISSNAHSERGQIQWLTSYEEAVKQSEATGRPIALFFTGSDWCTWCKRLEQEVLHTSEFGHMTADRVIFVELDFPMHKPLDPQLARQNQQLKDKYNVQGFPNLVLTDSKGKRIGEMGYQKGGGEKFGRQLLAKVSSFRDHDASIKDLGKQRLTHAELRDLYQKARELGHRDDIVSILEKGLKNDKDNFFQLEKYRFLLSEGEMHDREALVLRNRILSGKDEALRAAHYNVAIIEFEALHDQMKRNKTHAALAVAPLVDYVERFGNEDVDNVWRMQMTISQVYLEKNAYPEALRYAESARSAAPAQVQPNIDKAITYIKSQSGA